MPVVPHQALSFIELPGRASANPVPSGLGVGYTVRIVRVPPGARTPHRHPRSDEVTYVAAGQGTAWEDGRPTRVGAGDIVFVPRGAAHATVADDASELVLICFFPDEDLRSNTEELDGPLHESE